METPLKQRLIGAAVLVALAVIFLPMLIQGPAPESGVSDVSLTPPDAPVGQYETRDLPLVAPGTAPDSGVVGMDASAPAPGADAAATSDNPDAADLATPVAPLDSTAGTSATPLAEEEPIRSDTMLPAPTAGGNFAVNFGAFSTAIAADKLIASLRASQLPGYREAATVNGKTVQRVRIGPYATRAEAEAARLRASHVRDDVGARVVALDAEVETAAAKPAPIATTTAKPAETTKPAVPAVKPAPKPVAANNVGFALQLAAFSKAADATTLRDKLRAAGFSAFTESVSTDKGTLTRVRVGPVLNRSDADQLKAQVKSKLGMDGIVRPHP